MHKKDYLGQYVDWFFRVTNLLALLAIGWFLYCAVYLRDTRGRTPAVCLGLSILFLCMVGAVLRERFRRKIEGYYVTTLGSAECGTIDYHEGDNTVRFFFDRAENRVRVPADDKWERYASGWARARKPQIMSRVKKHAKGWKYVEDYSFNFFHQS